MVFIYRSVFQWAEIGMPQDLHSPFHSIFNAISEYSHRTDEPLPVADRELIN